jgi:formamidopyrimidine-DNA glycosylase
LLPARWPSFSHNDPMPELPEVEVTRQHRRTLQGAQVRAGAAGQAAALAAGRGRPNRCRAAWPARWCATRQVPVAAAGRPGARRRPRARRACCCTWACRARWPVRWAPRPPARTTTSTWSPTAARCADRPAALRCGGVVPCAATPTRPPSCWRLGAEPFDPALTPGTCTPRCKAGARRSRRRCWPATSSWAPATSTPARRCSSAGIDPRTPLLAHQPPRAERLLAALRLTLARPSTWAARRCATSRRPRHGGAFQDEALVYGREGLPCPRCGGTMRRIVQGQRSTYFCPAASGGEDFTCGAPADACAAPCLPCEGPTLRYMNFSRPRHAAMQTSS